MSKKFSDSKELEKQTKPNSKQNSKEKENVDNTDEGKLTLTLNKSKSKASFDKKVLNIDKSKKPKGSDVQSDDIDKSEGKSETNKEEDKAESDTKGINNVKGTKGRGKDENKMDEKAEAENKDSGDTDNNNSKQSKAISGNKSMKNGTSYTTDQAAVDALYKSEEQRRIYGLASASLIQDQIQSDLKNQRIVADKELESRTALGIELQGDTFIPTYNGSRKVVNKCPSILKIVSSKAYNAENLAVHNKSRYPFLKDVPIIQESRDLFAEGTDVVRVILKTENCDASVSIDPQEQIKSKNSLFRNVIVAQTGSVNPPWRSDSDTNIQHVFTAIFAYLPELVKSCRVIYEMDPPQKPLLSMAGTDRMNIYDDILNHISIYKFPINYGTHLILGAVDHPLEWFMDDVVEMIENDARQYVFGETRTRSELKLGRKREVESVEATDQFAAALLHIDKTRRMRTKMDVRTYITWLRHFSIDGVQIDHLNEHDDADYEIEGLIQADSDAFIFCFLTSKQFQTAMIEKLVKYISDFGLIKSVSLSEALKTVRGPVSSQTRESLVSELQSKLETVDVSTFVRLIVYDVLAVFVPVRYTIRAVIHDELESFPYLFMNLICIVLFKNIFAQNMHIIGFNICDFLYHINFAHYMKFQNQHGFSSSSRIPILIRDDAYKNGEIPKIFDPSVVTNIRFIGRIRKLLNINGEEFTLHDQGTLRMPRLESEPQGYIPYQKVNRSSGYPNTPTQDLLWEVIDIVKEVGLSYTTQIINDRRSNISDYLRWIQALKPMMQEFSAMIHFEGNYIYRLIMRHYACIYTDIKSADDYKLTEKMRVAIRSDSQSDMEPFLIERDPIKIPYTLPLSCVFTIEGIYSVINRYQTNDVAITVPDPQVQFKEFYGIAKGCRNMTEVLAMSRHILRDDSEGILKSLTRFAQYASKKVVYKEVLRLMAGFTKNMPADFLTYAERSINYTNNLQFWDPYVVFVNKLNDIQQIENHPDIMDRSLVLSDEFLAQEIEVVSDLLFNNSFLFHICRGIRIFRQQVDFLQPSLPPKKWEDYKVCINGKNNEILRTSFHMGRNILIFAIYDEATDTELEFKDLTPAKMPKVMFQCEHPFQISPKYREHIVKLVKEGVFGFEFSNFWYQASVYYEPNPPASYPDLYIDQIFSTYNDDLPLVVFPDTSRKIMYLDGPPSLLPYQYLWTTEDIQNDILMRDISGNRRNPLSYVKPKPENWLLGKSGPSIVPKFSNSISKTKSGHPNFLNTVVAHRKDTINYTFPPVEITAPTSLLG